MLLPDHQPIRSTSQIQSYRSLRSLKVRRYRELSAGHVCWSCLWSLLKCQISRIIDQILLSFSSTIHENFTAQTSMKAPKPIGKIQDVITLSRMQAEDQDPHMFCVGRSDEPNANL
ncbi:hypothetical protein RF11_06548 [Thelohanellus kitauei]|uniref:Uncharacterized protein n=1 Tax=Thelohanellus kitauei TaxID=669202 RepID=A0A0C2MB64_THEKT|nr:hypothetical protein RF11_06548 [Thelohanellus kitauei]